MIRADLYLASFGFAKSRQSAKNLIESGKVRIDGRTVKKPSDMIDESVAHSTEVEREKYVCRGALKLEGALEAFGIDVSGKTCIDIGASTGGFTDVLLQKNAAAVYAIDSGHGQLDPSLSENERVTSIEGYNARGLAREDFPCVFDVAVMDVSFISQTYIHSGVFNVLSCEGILISLIKPQFEAGRGAVGKNGIVKRKEDREAAIIRVVENAAENGLYCRSLMRSPIDGGDGNIEYLAYFTKNKNEYYIDRAFVRSLIKKEGRG